MIQKLAIGTAQFGTKYGIANKRGQIPKQEVFKILDYAYQFGVNTLDTAYIYGESEEIIGEFIYKSGKDFYVVSKLPDINGKESSEINGHIIESLERLKTSKLYGYLIHKFDNYIQNGGIWEILMNLKKQGIVEKIGFSLYHPQELDILFDRKIKFDLIQLPYNIFDRRFERYFILLKDQNVEIHIRSIFLQGLFFLSPDDLPPKLKKAEKYLTQLQRLSKKYNLPINAICMNFVLTNPYIDKVLIGVDSLKQLEENIRAIDYYNKVENLKEMLSRLELNNEEILLPCRWKIL